MRSFVNLCERSSGASREEVSMGATALEREDAAFKEIVSRFKTTSPACLVGTGKFLLIFSSLPRSWIDKMANKYQNPKGIGVFGMLWEMIN